MTSEVEITDEMVDEFLRVWRGEGHGYIVDERARMALAAVAPMIARAAYERGQADMRERAATVVDGSVRQQCCGYGQGNPPECCGCPNIEFDDPANTAAAIRALPTGASND